MTVSGCMSMTIVTKQNKLHALKELTDSLSVFCLELDGPDPSSTEFAYATSAETYTTFSLHSSNAFSLSLLN